MATDSFYPEVRAGDDVIFSTQPHVPLAEWRLGKVTMPKTNSCDITILGPHGDVPRRDCLHADDPLVATSRVWAETGRGIFRLAPHVIEDRQRDATVAALESKVLRLERNIEELAIAIANLGPRRGRPPKETNTDGRLY